MFSKKVQSYINQIIVEEKVIQQDEKVFCQQADSASLMIWMAGCNALYCYLNSNWLEFTGTHLKIDRSASARGQEISNVWTSSIHPKDRRQCKNIYLKAFTSHNSFQRQYRLRRADGEYRWILDTAVPRFAADGSFVGYIGYCVDVTEVRPLLGKACSVFTNSSRRLRKLTEQKQAAELTKAQKQLQAETAKRQLVESQLRQKTSEFAAILQVLPGLYFRIDADGNILDYKPGKIDNLYMTTEDCQGKSLRECLPIVISDRLQQAITQVLETQSPVSFEYTLPLPQGKNNFEARLLPLPEQQIIVLVRDTSDKVQAALIESDTKFRTIIENANNIIFALTLEGIFSYVSPNWTEIFGHEVAEVEGQSFVPFIHPDDVPICADYFQRIATTTQKQDPIEYRVKHKNGTWRWHTSNSSAIRDGNGNVLNFVGICHDTTDRKQAEVALRESVQREALLNRLSNQIRASLDLNYIVETAVQEIRNLFQIDRCAFFWYRQDSEVPHWERVYEAKSSSLACLLDDREATNAEIELIAAKTLNREIIRINDVETVNNHTAQLFLQKFGFTAFMSLPVHTQSGEIGAFSCGSYQGFRPWLDNEVDLLQAVTVQLAIAIDQAKLYTQSRIAAQTAQDKAQQLEAALLELQQTQAQLIQTEKMSSLGQLVAGIAHEINNPVNFIYGNIAHASEYTKDLLDLVELYQQSYCPPTPEIRQQIYNIDLDFLKEDLPKILDSLNMGAERIRQIVLSLRNFSRLDEDGMKRVDIHEGIDSALLLLQNRLKTKPGHPEIQVIRDYGNLQPVVCHAGQMNQVFMNVLTNAIDVLEESFVICHLSLANKSKQRTNDQGQMTSPQIRIRTLIQENRVIISIADNGPGMTEEIRKRLFDPFFTTKPVGKGTGMGLSISYQIVVQKHGGQIQCISAPGEGAEFVIMIPLHQQPST
ncbi:MAG: PAS domain S-box protein [Nostoc sp. DedVER02]|uniref:PAS domain S-box protein n=1 Tax=unclassified Nostoc TaxID=2593658 RepID=UPI002AD50826|nr:MULTISPECIES: PAS domain S-box protein [unclassified Nostoc]MDZ7990458.1 PAS domain S-box protein [Nostoc sp. DedVER02]MDZ8115850.1 PAS domain S-box protein [Nostoc sp. DedVER01b]